MTLHISQNSFSSWSTYKENSGLKGNSIIWDKISSPGEITKDSKIRSPPKPDEMMYSCVRHATNVTALNHGDDTHHMSFPTVPMGTMSSQLQILQQWEQCGIHRFTQTVWNDHFKMETKKERYGDKYALFPKLVRWLTASISSIRTEIEHQKRLIWIALYRNKLWASYNSAAHIESKDTQTIQATWAKFSISPNISIF